MRVNLRVRSHAVTIGAVTVGAGAAEALLAPGSGRVVGCFSHGCYVRTATGLAALAGPAVSPGPLHVTLPHDLPTVEGEPVALDGDQIWAEGWHVDLRQAARYDPAPPASVDRLRQAVSDDVPWPGDVSVTEAEVVAALAALGLDAARRLLQGRGGGLTPSGDDVLAGALLVAAWSGSSQPPGVAAAAETTELSLAFLRWAAAGQSIQPVHDLVERAACGDLTGAAAAARRVAGVGASSGTALLAGLRVACSSVSDTKRPSLIVELLPPIAAERASCGPHPAAILPRHA